MPTTLEAVHTALAGVNDPEIRKPITELDMVKSVDIDGGHVSVALFLTVAGCPMKETLTRDVRAAVGVLDGVEDVLVELDVMSAEQRETLKSKLRGGQAGREVPFAKPGSLTRVYAVASGKGGVGKSSITVNLAAAMAAEGMAVGVLDADVYGFSVPRMLGVTQPPTRVDDMILPPLASLAVTIFLGWMFLISGVAGLALTFWARQMPGFWWSLVSAALAVLAGIVLLTRPVQGVLTLTIVIGAYFLAEGVTTIMYALEHRRELSERWSWLLFAGILDILIAAMIITGLPGSAEWAIGLLVGINLLFGGASLIGMALAARKG